ncbi:hypothetical protein HQ576_12050 [bacterium]|nr:hypothetical protein [bacterium]
MNTRVLVSVFAIVALALGFGIVANSVNAEEEKPQTLIGTVSVSDDDDGNITAVKLTVGETVYNVTLDENGRKLGAQMADKKAEVTAIVREQDDEKWLVVKSFKEVKREEAPEE